MENAAKALLISASVLIVVVLIAFGIRILSSTSGTVNQAERASTTMEVYIFNSQFDMYLGNNVDVKNVKELAKKVLINNAKISSSDDPKGIRLLVKDSYLFSTTEISTFINNLEKKAYNVSIEDVDEVGRIKTIRIE